jgi:hypothetical protein
METVLGSGPLAAVLVAVAALYAGVVAWKSFDYVRSERRRRRENAPPSEDRGPPS